MPEWLKQLWKTTYFIFQVPPGIPGWLIERFESLTIGIVFFHFYITGLGSSRAYLRCSPTWHGKVCKTCKEKILDAGDFLCKLLLECWRLHSMPGDVVQWMLFFGSGKVTFYVNHLGEESKGGERKKDLQDHLRFEKASWGNKNHSPKHFLPTCDGDHALVPYF
jgi:hypothetical protein